MNPLRLLPLLLFLLPAAAGPRREASDVLGPGTNLNDEAERTRIVRDLQDIENDHRTSARTEAAKRGLPVRRPLPGGRMAELMDWVDGQPLYRCTANAHAAISTGASLLRVNPWALTGAGVTIGLWDGGAARASHREFAGRIIIKDGASGIDHATHVAGTLAASGVDGSARGMAPASAVDSYDWNNDVAEMTARAATGASDPTRLHLSNHSYNLITGWQWTGSFPAWEWNGNGTTAAALENDFGRYTTSTRDMDSIAASAPYYLIFRSAGNERTDSPDAGDTIALSPGGASVTYDPALHPPGDGRYRGGFDTISFYGLAKNSLTVGSVSDAVSGEQRQPSAAAISNFSSWGPTDDGRIKPDIVANGESVYSCLNSGDAAYGSYNGTSMSSPGACGSAALLIELYSRLFPGKAMRASTLKGLIIHTADDLGNAGPDYKFGWGLMNAERAARIIQGAATAVSSPALIEGQLTSGITSRRHAFVWDGVSPIRATLSWTDPAGNATTTADSRTARLVNNLNLKIVAPDAAEHLPYTMPFVGTWTQDSMNLPATRGTNNTDNVEQVYLASPSRPGLYEAVVSIPAAAAQTYSLILSGTAPTPPSVTAVTPFAAPQGMISLTVEGYYFVPGATVLLSRPGQPDAAAEVTAATATALTCTLNTGSMMPGLWNVTVTNPDGLSGSLAGGFAVVTTLWGQDFDGPAPPPGWSVNANAGTTNWAVVNTASHSPAAAWFATGPSTKSTGNLVSEAIDIPPGASQLELSFWHRYHLDSGNDGGVLEFSLDGGTWSRVGNTGTAEAISTGGYPVTMNNNLFTPAANKNEFAGQSAWSGNSGTAFSRVAVTLKSTAKYAGHSLRARWRLGTNNSTASPGGWYVDTVRLTGIPGTVNTPPSIVSEATADPAVVTGHHTSLFVTADDAAGEPQLTYTWSAGEDPVTFSPNGTNAAKAATATFSRAGTYHLEVTVRDPAGATAVSGVTVTVEQSPSAVVLSPESVTVPWGGTQLFSASLIDQFGHDMSSPAFTWSTTGGGTVSGEGLFTAQTPGGPYTVSATSGSLTGSAAVTVSKAAATVTLDGLIHAYDGNPHAASATTVPADLPLTFSYSGSPGAPTAAGSYPVTATVNDPNYEGSASGVLVIHKAAATVTLDGLIHAYDGNPHAASATTVPADLPLTFSYSGSPGPPTAAGSYPVTATVNDPNYEGSASGVLVIHKAAATVTLDGLMHTYDGNPHAASATTVPADLPLTFSYSGSPGPPTAAGSYPVTATVNDPNYEGSASGVLVIHKAAATVTLDGLMHTYDGNPHPASATTVPADLPVTFSYSGSPGAPTAAGSYPVTATVNDPNYEGSASGTLFITGQPLADWQAQHFTPEEIARGDAADQADPDADEFSNLAEYALGSDPRRRTPPLETRLLATGFWLIFDRPAGLPDVVCHAEASPGNGPWENLPLTLLADGPVQTIGVADPAGPTPSRRFVRLRFTRP